MIIPLADDDEVLDLAESLLTDGSAHSKRQASWMARILLSETLSPPAKTALMILVQKKGADADLTRVTYDDIDAAISDLFRLSASISLDLATPAGSA